MRILTFANHKGGVGKTTSTLAVAQQLAHRGHRVLLLDCDPQHNLTMSFPVQVVSHLGHVIQGEKTLRQILLKVGPNLALAPAALELTQLEKVLGQQPAYQFFLRDQLEDVAAEFDYCLIDTPPALTSLTYGALVASDAVFIPTQPEFFGYEGLNTLLEAVRVMAKNFNQKLKVGGLFLTKYSPSYRFGMHHDVVEVMRDNPVMAPLLMATSIRQNGKLAEAQIEKQDLYSYAPESAGAQDYEELTTEMLARL
ncbi:ParA family protein (plasmid) [Hymenobacter tibetensis]|uniref:ParA family protein n=1 Tax=Hymenobacter tibetensis TaxID=497967 RepID=A0ABY4DC11_9BACT|nr:ParA family protein [Hymenobacter tibetensis]UOG77618.1 ParA family protein [Hymenobacter tibetensis]